MLFSANTIKELACAAGFSSCGIARARSLDVARGQFEDALAQGRQASMRFLERDVDKRFNPEKLLPGCQSVIVVTYNYCIDEEPASDKYRTARYTWIEDYHVVVKELLDRVVEQMRTITVCQCRVTVDSSCISEKNWAVEAGIGCYGKNGLIHNDSGSFFVIGTILTDIEFDCYDTACESDCGDCRLCVESCPAHALETPFCVDARKCFSFHTVENKDADRELLGKAPLLFGCDVCQEVCPRNQKKRTSVSGKPKTSLFLRLQNEQFENLSKEDFKRYFGNTSIARRKYDRFIEAVQTRNKESQ